ncbi:SsgA family sporulation/cell division regulator [Kitasatospora acidiphila]|uniref:SsgA family sporulation/cell division regulator n=1 Tax=Kitasatospora acidiphila TaxID=2567942 RepID=A0A540VYD4_9ACTN|nr:SsgA family sporulation/cell division regulator [Kitasatospora acidiphila]TQF01790.1 SsgA family sporulation/cell division regulator [Kitasatospora acidiphila]
MSVNDSTVTAEVEIELLVPGQPERIALRSTWAYDSYDPLAVRVDFLMPLGGPERWTFARELLAEGLDAPAGDGDVVLQPEADLDHVRMLLRGANGAAAVLWAAERALRDFLDRSYAHVPSGGEQCTSALDRWLVGVLEED